VSEIPNIYYTEYFTEFTSFHLILGDIIGVKSNGFFVEIGAYDGITNSKTARLADIGWRGVYAEPVSEYFELCRKRHESDKVKVLQVAVSDVDTEEIIYKSEMASTLVQKNMQQEEDWAKGKGKSFNFKEEKVKVLSWQSFAREFATQEPDLFVLDAEGYDWKIIQCIDFSVFRPHIICCEVFTDAFAFIHEEVKQDGQKVKAHLLQNGYDIYCIEHNNILFVRKDVFPSSYPKNEALLFLCLHTYLQLKDIKKVSAVLKVLNDFEFTKTEFNVLTKAKAYLLLKDFASALADLLWLKENVKETKGINNLIVLLQKVVNKNR